MTVFDAVDKGLGLKLELKTAPRSVWIVDGVNEWPTPNSPAVAKDLPALPPAQFEVATIKPSRPDPKPMAMVRSGQMTTSGMSLKFLITFAWDLNPTDSQMIVNALKWLDEGKFDVLAKAEMPEVVPGRPAAQIDQQEFRQMLRALVTERFKLQAHMEDRAISAYSLIVGRPNPNLKEADPKSGTHCKAGAGPNGKDPRTANPMLTALWTCQNVTMKQMGEELAHFAAGYVYAPVLDSTGLKGSYDFTLAWSSASLTILKPPPSPTEQQAAGQQGGE